MRSSGSSFAQARSYDFDIPEQSLSASLRDFARICGEEIIFTDDLVSGKTAAPLRGSYSADEALSRLLAGTGLFVDRSISGAVMIRKDTRAEQQFRPRPNPVDPVVQPENVVVTGTLIVANGYQAPTLVTTVTTEDLLRDTPESIPAGLEQLPQFTMSAGANNYGTQAGTPGAGNYLNLRGLGAIEGLTLMDGARLPATSFNGTVDANIIPQAFVSRVDVVTGGASADLWLGRRVGRGELRYQQEVRGPERQRAGRCFHIRRRCAVEN